MKNSTTVVNSLVKNLSWWQLGLCGFICILLYIWVVHNILSFTLNKYAKIYIKEESSLAKENKYILEWADYYLFVDHEVNMFPRLNCSTKNCVFTRNRRLLSGDYSNFDAILFHEQFLDETSDKPQRRNPYQLYIFTSIESPTYWPACELQNDDFFNWTFTYRLDSDILWGFFVVRDTRSNIVAPRENVTWDVSEKAIDQKVTDILKGRTRAAAWIVSHCRPSGRSEYLSALQEHLLHYSLELDVYGNCSQRRCGTHEECEEMLRKHYFFYMAFENSIAVDYVTEKVLHGYNNYVVPIVFGGANYTRFLPPVSYINAREYHPYNLAGLIYKAVKSPENYLSYFGWTNLYTIDHEMSVYHPLCDLCAALHRDRAASAPAKKNFRFWWNTLNGMKWCLPASYWNETAKINIDNSHMDLNATIMYNYH